MRHVLLGTILAACSLAACGDASQPPKSASDATSTSNTSVDVAASPATDASSNDDIAKGTAAVKAEDWTAARTAFEAAIKKNPKQADAHYYLGLTMDKTGDRVSAEKNYKEALLLAPDLDEAAENLTAIYVEAKRFDDAILLARRTLARRPGNADMQLNFALALSGKGDVNAASKAFEDAIKLSPNDARYHLAYARHLTAAKKTSEAVARLKQAERVAGDDPALLGAIGFELRTARAVPECIDVFNKAISFKDNADFRTNRALCKYAAKDKSGAVVDLKVATQKEPDFAPAHYWLGLWLHEDGRFADAIAEYEAYLKAAPAGPMAKAAEEKSRLAKEKKMPPRR